jgi:hypothetical protein
VSSGSGMSARSRAYPDCARYNWDRRHLGLVRCFRLDQVVETSGRRLEA